MPIFIVIFFAIFRQYSINNTSGLQNFLRKLIQFDNRKHFDIPEYDELPSHLYLEVKYFNNIFTFEKWKLKLSFIRNSLQLIFYNF